MRSCATPTNLVRFYTKCSLQVAYHDSDSMDDIKDVDLGPHPEVVDGVLLVVSFIFRHSPSSLRKPRHGDFAEQPDNSRIITAILDLRAPVRLGRAAPKTAAGMAV